MLIDIIKTSKANVLNKPADHLTFELQLPLRKTALFSLIVHDPSRVC